MCAHASSVQLVEPVHTTSPSRTTYLWCMRSGMPGMAVEGTAAANRASSEGPSGGGGTGTRRHRQHMVLLGPQPGRHVLEDHAEARPVGVVGTAAVPEGAEVEHHRTPLQLGGDGCRGLVGNALDPPVAPRHHPGGAVGLG